MSKSTFKWSPSWQLNDVEIKEDNLVYNGFFQVHEMHLRHRFFSGEWSPWLQREQIHRSDAGAVLLFDPKHDILVLIEQLRIGLLKKEHSLQSPWMLEIVAGLLEPNEDSEQTVQREAKEEANAVITKLFKIGEFYNTPGGFSEKTFVYCGLVDSTTLGGTHGVIDDHEDIFVHCLPMQSVWDALDKGLLITSASTVIALQWLRMKLLSDKLFFET